MYAIYFKERIHTPQALVMVFWVVFFKILDKLKCCTRSAVRGNW